MTNSPRPRVATILLLAALASPAAGEEAPPPPYLMTGANTVTIAVTWQADSLDGLLPAGVVPLEDFSGGLNVYDTEGGFGLGPYSAAYAYVNVQGWESVDGTPARHILGGWYGPDPRVAGAMRSHFNAPVTPGAATQGAEGTAWVGNGGAEDGTIRLEVLPADACVAFAGFLNYVGTAGAGAGLELLRIPYAGDFCPAEPVSVEMSGPEGSALDRLRVERMLAGGRLRDGTFAFTH